MTTSPTQTKTGACIVAGHICLDVIPELVGTGDFTATFQPGRLLEAGPVTMATGGTVSNTGQALHKLGIDTQLMGKVGDDMFGQTIKSLLQGLDPRLAGGMRTVPGEASSYTIILSPPNTDRIFFHCPGANDTFGPADIDYETLRRADLFHFGYPQLMKRIYENNGAALVEIFKRAKETGVTTSLDVTMPDPNSPAGKADWPTIFAAVLPYIDIFTPSIEEILLMLRPDVFKTLTEKETGAEILDQLRADLFSEIAAELLGLGAKIILLKANYLGLYLRTGAEASLVEMGRACPADLEAWVERELWAPAFETTVVGTTGAGDSAIAGLLAALLRGHPPVEAVTIANAVGACNVEAPDAVSGLQPWSATLARIEAGWTRRKLAIDMRDWRFDEVHQLWLGPFDRSVTSLAGRQRE